jgi:hypothetical protein
VTVSTIPPTLASPPRAGLHRGRGLVIAALVITIFDVLTLLLAVLIVIGAVPD